MEAIQLKDSQGLAYIVKHVSTPLIHLIHFSQLSFFYCMNTQDSNWWQCVLHETQSQVRPHQYHKKEEKIKPQNIHCRSALI